MKQLHSLILVIAFAGISLTVNSQSVPLGSWKDYLSYRQGVTVTLGNGKIYCVAGAGIFSYNLSDNSIEKYSKINGLSDISPSTARFCQAANTLVIGYPDGNMDLLQGSNIVNIPDLKNAPVQGTRTINNIYFIGTQAYICCGQGILQVDLTQDVILNTIYLGPGGTPLNVTDVTVCNDTMFATTVGTSTVSGGIYKIALSDPNPSDYLHWVLVTGTIPSGKNIGYGYIVTQGDSIITNYSTTLSGASGNDREFVYYNGKWGKFIDSGFVDNVNGMQTYYRNGKNYLVLSTRYNSFVVDQTNSFPKIYGGYNGGQSFTNDALIDANMNIWIADAYIGLVKGTPAASYQIFDPPGPYSNDVNAIAVSNNTLWIAPEGLNSADGPIFSNTPVSTFQNGTWTYISTGTFNHVDQNCIALDPNNQYHAFVGSYTNGLFEYNNTSFTQLWDTTNTNYSLTNVDVSGFPNVRVAGVCYDTLGNLWVSASQVTNKFLAVKETTGKWVGVDFTALSAILSPLNTIVTQVLVTHSQAKWILSPAIGIIVYQDNGTFAPTANTGNTIIITTAAHNGALPSQNIYCMTEDQNGSIWVGTDQRVVVFYSPDNVFDGNGDWDAQPVYVTQNTYTQYLMQNQVTTCITVDGANRKWIGTQGGGVFLMSADGTQQILNFTSSNSPLLSNNITCISINPTTGEVFFGTDKGIVSYRGSATEGGNTFGNVYAFPNPVPHGYDGPVAITGLVTNSDVKITTISGEIVYHTTALGGQAIWNGTNFDGKRVQTGVYLVFCNSPDGSQTHIAKLLFIN